MLKTFINKALKAALSEVFTNANDGGGVSLSMGADLFSESNLNLKNLNIRTDIFDVLLQPLKLVSGHVGSLKLEGIAELAFGGKLRLTLDSIYLLFQVDEDMNAERAQILKKLLLELTSSNSSLPQLLLREILKKVQSYPSTPGAGKDGVGGDVKKKRRLIIKGLNYIFTNIVVFLKALHIRIEVPSTKDKSCAGFGWTLPQLKIIPYTSSASNTRPTSHHLGVDFGGLSPQLTMYLKSLQMYCDYNCTSYTTPSSGNTGTTLQDIVLQEFKIRWLSESHTAMLLPIDLEVSLAIEVRKRTGLLSFKVATDVSSLRIACDPKQLEILVDFMDRYVAAHKKLNNLLRVRGIFGRKWMPPVISEVGGITILPHLLIGGQQYPQLGSIPRGKVGTSIVALLKSRLGPNWAKALWRHVYRLVIEDLRKWRPMGRWVELIKLVWTRKQYSFIYSRLLRRSKETGNFVINVNAKVDVNVALKLFDMEMMLPTHTVYLFRCLSVMICFVELMNSKRKQAIANKASNGVAGGNASNNGVGISPYNGMGMSYEKINISWRTILRVHSEIIESQRLTAFHKSEKLSPDDDAMTEMGDYDDSASVMASEDGSVHSSSTRGMAMAVPGHSNYNPSKNMPKSPKPEKFSFFTRQSSSNNVNASTVTAASATSAMLSTTSKTMYGTAKAALNVQNAAMKMLGQAITGSTAGGDDLDNKFLGRNDLMAFAEWFALFEKEDKASFDMTSLLLPSNTVSMVETAVKVRPPAGPGAVTPATNPAASQLVPANTVGGTPVPTPPSGPEILNLKDIKLEVFDWNLGGNPPSEVMILDGVQAIFSKDQLPITVVPPDISFCFHHVEWNLRYPLENNSRRIIAALVLKDVSANIIISHGNALSPTNSQAAAHDPSFTPTQSLLSRNQRLDDNQLRSLQGFVSLMGSLIQLRLTINQIEVSMHVHNDDLCKVLNGESVHFPNAGRKNTISSAYYVEPTQPSTAIAYDNDDMSSVGGSDNDRRSSNMSNDGADDQTSSEHHSMTAPKVNADNQAGWDDLLAKYKPPSPMTKSSLEASEAPAIAPIAEEEVEVVNIITSKSTDRFLILCVLLDFDYKGEGAADVQMQLGEFTMDMNGGGLAALVDDSTIRNLHRIGSTLRNIGGLVLESKSPFHLRLSAYDDLNNRKKSNDELVAGVATGSDTTSESPLVIPSKQVPRSNVLSLLNTEHWRSILDYILPKIVTVSARSSKIQADLFSASVIRNIILSTFQEVSNRASVNRQNRGEMNDEYALNIVTGLPPILGMLQELRKRATRASADFSFRQERSKFALTPIEINICKTADPSPHVDIKGFGMEMKLPIDDETLVVALALFFGKYFPVYL